MIDLLDITLLTISGTDDTNMFLDHLRSLCYSKKNINFGKIKILSPIKPIEVLNDIEYIKIEKLSYSEYSDFIIRKLNNYVDTKYVLIIQSDGFVTNVDKYDPRFLEYDYIGAPWRNIKHYNFIRVGNGGFSLRSKRFLEVCQKYCPTHGFNEDHLVCITYRDIFLNNGIKYAPLEIASLFSYESGEVDIRITQYDTFGIHGKNDYYRKIVESNEWINILQPLL
jgi:hypothetical protein